MQDKSKNSAKKSKDRQLKSTAKARSELGIGFELGSAFKQSEDPFYKFSQSKPIDMSPIDSEVYANGPDMQFEPNGSGGGGVPEGFEEEVLDIVDFDENSGQSIAGRRIFLTKEEVT